MVSLFIGLCVCALGFRYALGDAVIENSLDGRSGETELIKAAREGSFDGVEAALRKGVAVNQAADDREQRTALHWACYGSDAEGSRQMIPLLVKWGANVDAVDSFLSTPLHLLIWNDQAGRQVELISYLVKQGADINARDNKGRTFLHRLVENRNHDSTRLLLDKLGFLVDFGVKDNRGFTPYELAQDFTFTSIADAIYQAQEDNKDNKKSNDRGLTQLMAAVIKNKNNDNKRVLELIESRVDLDEKSDDEYRRTALYMAVLHKNPFMVGFLLDKGASQFVADSDGNYPIHAAVTQFTEFQRLVVTLLRSNSEEKRRVLRLSNKVGNTALHHAVLLGNLAAVSFLVSSYWMDLDLMAQNEDHKTPSQLAESFGRADFVRIIDRNAAKS